ncbi:MAG: hypothetical protein M1839_004481 [Geoglossum umbratile]|nr:MAG: hypothetical protein M1839_004481 [Geoglossum umbratile]
MKMQNLLVRAQCLFSSGARPFTHTPLDVKEDQIRLISLDRQPLAVSSCIRLSIRTFRRDACPEYDALSYVWGPESPAHNILLNGKSFRVRDNLYAFLENAISGAIESVSHSSEYCVKYLWIDQLCIDQTSVLEKNHQVQRMGEIYKNAGTVVAWLGAASSGSNDAMDFMMRTVRFAMDSLGHVSSSEQRETVWAQYLKNRENSFRNVRAIFNRSYWSRLWVVQEFLLPLPKQLIIACGERFIEWEDIFRLHNVSGWSNANMDRRKELYGAAMPLFSERSEGFWLDCDGRRITGSYRRRSSDHHYMCVYLKRFADQRCLVPHDHIYALLAAAGLEDEVRVDYSKSPSAVYWDFLGVLLKADTTVGSYIYVGLAMNMGLTGRKPEAQGPEVQKTFKELFRVEGSIEEVFAGKCKGW